MSGYDPETGELFEERSDFQSAAFNSNPRETLSQKAMAGAHQGKIPYWDKRQGIMQSNNDQWFNRALSEVQKELPAILEADAFNPFHKSKYVSLGHLLSKLKPILQKNEIFLKQGTGKIYAHGSSNKEPRYFLPVFLEIVHAPTGESERQMIEVPLTKLDPQAVGIASTYGRRYLLLSYFSIASMDDDAASALAKRIDRDEEADAAFGIIEKIKECQTLEELQKWAKMNQSGIDTLSEKTLEKLRQAYSDRQTQLQDSNTSSSGKPKK
jgi:hypothetical protein